jgi:hypothetical protein
MRRVHRAWALGLVAACWLAAVPAARADGGPSLAVVELYLGGDREPVAGAWSQALERELAEMRRMTVVDRSMALTRLAGQGIVPARQLSDLRLEAVDRQVRDGEELLYTDPAAAVDLLTRSLQELEAGVEAMAVQPRMRDLLLRTRMLLARAHLDAGAEDAAVGVLREVVAAYGDDLSVTTRDYHPLMVQAYERTVREMAGARAGSLEIDGAFGNCKAWIDGRQVQGALPGTFPGLFVGSRLVQVRCGDKSSLLHRVMLTAASTVTVAIDVDFERAVVFDGEQLGLVFRDAGEAAQYATRWATRLGRLIGVDRVALHWRETGSGGGDAVLSMVDVAAGAETDRVRVGVKSAAVNRDAARMLAQQAIKGGPAGGGGGKGGWKKNVGAWVLSGVGAAALIAGAVEGGLYFKYKADATKAYDLSVPTRAALEPQYESRKDAADKANTARIVGPVLLGVGGAALVGGILWFVLDDDGEKATADRGVIVTPYWAQDGGGLAATFSF